MATKNTTHKPTIISISSSSWSSSARRRPLMDKGLPLIFPQLPVRIHLHLAAPHSFYNGFRLKAVGSSWMQVYKKKTTIYPAPITYLSSISSSCCAAAWCSSTAFPETDGRTLWHPRSRLGRSPWGGQSRYGRFVQAGCGYVGSSCTPCEGLGSLHCRTPWNKEVWCCFKYVIGSTTLDIWKG